MRTSVKKTIEENYIEMAFKGTLLNLITFRERKKENLTKKKGFAKISLNLCEKLEILLKNSEFKINN